MERLLNVTTGLSVVLLFIVLISVRRAHIRAEYSISWLIGSVAMLALSRSWRFLEWVRSVAGLPDTPLALFLAGSSVLLIMFFRFSIIVSRLKDNNIALAQRVAILEYHLNALGTDEKQQA